MFRRQSLHHKGVHRALVPIFSIWFRKTRLDSILFADICLFLIAAPRACIPATPYFQYHSTLKYLLSDYF
jgi:hypothetical protein